MFILRFIGSRQGRVVRVVVGLLLITFGISGEGTRRMFAIAGLVPLSAGVFDICLLGPLFRLPLGGKAFRESSATS